MGTVMFDGKPAGGADTLKPSALLTAAASKLLLPDELTIETFETEPEGEILNLIVTVPVLRIIFSRCG